MRLMGFLGLWPSALYAATTPECPGTGQIGPWRPSEGSGKGITLPAIPKRASGPIFQKRPMTGCGHPKAKNAPV